MDARLTRDGLLRVELRLTAGQRRALYARCEELRRARGEPLSDQECLRLLLAGCLAGAEALFAEARSSELGARLSAAG
jgi:hypothetical protein